MMKIRLGTRGSRLALWQAHRVADLIRKASPGTGVELVIIKTTGDERSEFGEDLPEEVGEFSSELEKQLAQEVIDAAVHSAKDLPTQFPKSLCVAAYPERADPRDALVRKRTDSEKPSRGSVVATGSPRRDMLWRERWKETEIRGIRGNVDRRLEKLEDDVSLWGLVLACAGIDRLGGVPEKLVMERLDPSWMVPAPGQGALAVECRRKTTKCERFWRRSMTRRCEPVWRRRRVFCRSGGEGVRNRWGLLGR